MRADAGTFRKENTADPPICEKQREGKSNRIKTERNLTIIVQRKERFT